MYVVFGAGCARTEAAGGFGAFQPARRSEPWSVLVAQWYPSAAYMVSFSY